MQTLSSAPNPQPAAAFTLEDWRSGYRSQPQEFAYWIEDVEGQVPLDLTGTLFRNGPGLLDIHGHPVRHPFDGDGMVSSIAFHQGRAFYRNRFVRTTGYVAEQAAQKPLYRGVFGTQKPGGWWANAFDLTLKNIANTQVIYWGGKLLALWEAAEPHRLDPHTLETVALDNLQGVLKPGDAFAAHPRIDPGDPAAGVPPRLVNFGIKAGLSSTITLFEFDPQGTLVGCDRHTVPGFAFLHDFAITPNYAIFCQNPVSFSPLGFLLGWKGAAECIKFNPKQPTKLLILPRGGAGPAVTVTAPPSFIFHHANAFEQDGQLVLDSIAYQEFPSLDEGMSFEEVDFGQLPQGQLWRYTIGADALQGKAPSAPATADILIQRCCEFPGLNPGHVGRPYRYLFLGAADQATGNAPLQALLKRDLATGAEELWSEAPRGFMGEPVFVPRPGATAEDEGWVLCLTYNAARQCSDLLIFQGQSIAPGPIARLKLRHHVPYGLHGSFTPEYFGPEG